MEKSKQNNDLETFLTNQYELLKPYTNHIYWGVIAFLAILCAGYLYMHYSQVNKAFAWESYSQALATADPLTLEKLCEERLPLEMDTRIRISSAGLFLSQASEYAFSDRAKAIESLEKARSHFETAKRNSSVADLTEQAAFGLARTYETLAALRPGTEDAKKAVEMYTLVAGNPDSPRASIAKKQIAFLEKADTQEFLAAFAKTETPKADDNPNLGIGDLNVLTPGEIEGASEFTE